MAIGNTKLDLLLRRVKMLDENIAWIQTFDGATRKEILEWIKKDQLTDKGVDKDGNVIGYYSMATDFITGGAKAFGEHFTLDDTGEFYESMYILVFKNSIVIGAETEKMEKQDWFTNSILGLTDENIQKLKEIVKKSYIKFARKTLGID